MSGCIVYRRPREGAWFETAIPTARSSAPLVAPHAGARIETRARPTGCLRRSPRPRVGGDFCPEPLAAARHQVRRSNSASALMMVSAKIPAGVRVSTCMLAMWKSMDRDQYNYIAGAVAGLAAARAAKDGQGRPRTATNPAAAASSGGSATRPEPVTRSPRRLRPSATSRLRRQLQKQILTNGELLAKLANAHADITAIEQAKALELAPTVMETSRSV